MKIFIKKLIMLLCICEITVACTPTMTRNLWNGVYSQQAAAKEYKRKRDELYAKESQEQRNLRKKNEIVCDEISGVNSGNWDQYKYIDCMEERGSPVY